MQENHTNEIRKIRNRVTRAHIGICFAICIIPILCIVYFAGNYSYRATDYLFIFAITYAILFRLTEQISNEIADDKIQEFISKGLTDDTTD